MTLEIDKLHRRVIKLEKLVFKLAKWTHFNLETFQSSSDDGDDTDDFSFEILPENDEDSNNDDSGGDDSDYSPFKFKASSRSKKRRKSSTGSGSGGVASRSCSNNGPGQFTWSLPSSSSVQRAVSLKSQGQQVKQDQESQSDTPSSSSVNVNVAVKSEVDFPDDFNDNDDMDIDGLLYPDQDQGDFDDDNGRIQIIPSQKGRPMIEKDGYLFQCAKNSNHKKIWRCDHFRASRCTVRLHTNDNLEYPRMLAFVGEHNHEPNPHASEVRKVVAVIRQEALQSNAPASEIIDKCLQQLPPELKEFLPRVDALKRSIRNVRGEINSSKKKPRRKLVSQNMANSSCEGDSLANVDNDDDESSRLAPQPPDNIPLQLLESRRGKPMLEKGGYLFQLSKLGNNKRIWRCDRFKVLSCPVRLHTTFNLENLETLGQLGVHTHVANPLTLEVRRVMAAIRQEALTTTQTPAQIVAAYLPQLPNEAKEMVRVDNVKRGIRKVRESLHNNSHSDQLIPTFQHQHQQNASSSTFNPQQSHLPQEQILQHQQQTVQVESLQSQSHEHGLLSPSIIQQRSSQPQNLGHQQHSYSSLLNEFSAGIVPHQSHNNS